MQTLNKQTDSQRINVYKDNGKDKNNPLLSYFKNDFMPKIKMHENWYTKDSKQHLISYSKIFNVIYKNEEIYCDIGYGFRSFQSEYNAENHGFHMISNISEWIKFNQILVKDNQVIFLNNEKHLFTFTINDDIINLSCINSAIIK
jgi:hypothetical protein